ncbi:MAG: hypothetical protein HY391_06140 [Deltaproteobacteria bacterium]|nr:hypothetical protein [Deltaproteobacteria bacterium]
MKAIFRSLLWSLCLLPMAASVAQAHNFDTMPLPGAHFRLADGETFTLSLREWRHVQKIYVQAEGSRGDATFEVIANGDVKGTIHVPGRDPSYVVTIGEAVNSIQFRHIQGYAVSIRDVTAVLSDWSGRDQGGFYGGRKTSLPVRNLSMQLASEAITLADQLEHYSNFSEYGTYLLPIKKVAARVYALASARGDLSWRVRDSLIYLKTQIAFASGYIEESFERDAIYELAIRLLTLQERIDDLLD